MIRCLAGVSMNLSKIWLMVPRISYCAQRVLKWKLCKYISFLFLYGSFLSNQLFWMQSCHRIQGYICLRYANISFSSSLTFSEFVIVACFLRVYLTFGPWVLTYMTFCLSGIQCRPFWLLSCNWWHPSKWKRSGRQWEKFRGKEVQKAPETKVGCWIWCSERHRLQKCTYGM